MMAIDEGSRKRSHESDDEAAASPPTKQVRMSPWEQDGLPTPWQPSREPGYWAQELIDIPDRQPSPLS